MPEAASLSLDDPANLLADALVEALRDLPLVKARGIPVRRVTVRDDFTAMTPQPYAICVVLPTPRATGPPLLQGKNGAEGNLELSIGSRAGGVSDRMLAGAYASRLAWEVAMIQQATFNLQFARTTLAEDGFGAGFARVKMRVFFQDAEEPEWEPNDKAPGGGTVIRWDRYASSHYEVG